MLFVQKSNKKLTKSGIKAIFSPFLGLLIQVVLFFVSAGHIEIIQGWIYYGVIFFALILSGLIMWKCLPELTNQRGRVQKGTESWDKAWLLIFFIMTIIIFPIIAGLDVGRFTWTSLSYHFMCAGIILYVLSFILILWAMFSNPYFEGTVRIQKEREHKVVSTGPYGIIRHPGNFSMILYCFSAPLSIGSVISLIPACIAIAALIVRTSLEDKTLQKELDGYSEYSKKVKYKLIPGIW